MKKRGQSPKYDHSKIKELLEAGKKPAKIVLVVGCTIWAVRYCQRKMKERKRQ